MAIVTCVYRALLTMMALWLLSHTAAAAITGLTIVDAGASKEVGPLKPNGIFKRSELPTEMSIIAKVDNPGATAKVEFFVNGVKEQTEERHPYAINGDKNSGKNYSPWKVPLGETKLSVKQTLKDGGDDVLDLTFTVNENGGGSTPAVSPTLSSSVGAQSTVSPSAVASISPTPSSGGDSTNSLKVNMGSSKAVDDFVGDDGSYVTGKSETSSGSGDGIYKTHRWGSSFGLDIKLNPGSYNVKLHFNENYNGACGKGKRVFTVTVGDKPPLQNLDVFAEAGGCNKPLTKMVEDVAVTDSLTVTLKASVQNAFISGIEVVPAATIPAPTVGTNGPVSPPPTPASAVDENAHAVPPIYDDPIIDLKKAGKVTVNMDGSGSHTHYFDTKTGQFAALKYFKWTNKETGEILCEGGGADKAFCKHTFPLGSTMVELCVTDTADFVNCADTTVTVVESISSGVYCYYYDFGRSKDVKVPLKMGLEAGKEETPKPLFGAESKDVSFPTLTSFPEFPFKAGSWAQRCVFFFGAPETETYKFTVKHVGGIALFVGDEEVISADASNSAKTSEGVIEIPEGLQKVDLVYFKTSEAAQMELSYNATAVEFKYDKATVLPIISSVTPNESSLEGAFVKIVGININKGTKVMFGDQAGTDPIYKVPTQVQVKSPKVPEEAIVSVVLSNQAGTSNAIPYSYRDDEIPSIKFTATQFKDFTPNGVANIAIGPDLKYYMSTTTGKVIVADVDHENDYSIKSTCESETLSDPAWVSAKTKKPAPRWALGVTFNPKDTSVKAYVATSSLFWANPSKDSYLQDDFAWANGNIEVLEPGDGCIKRTKIVIKGLPVSGHDHSVNSLVFDNKGDLHFQVGGFTNQGIPGKRLGNKPENPLSAASVVALTSKGSAFDGTVTYDNKDPASAKQTGGDVKVFASGLRNSYGLTLHSNGKFYATDNGPNKDYGDRSETCKTKLASKRHGDKILQLKKGKYYGAPNRNRGECVFINDDGKTPSGGSPPASLNFDPPLAKVESSTNGIMEYTANTFEGELRGDLFASKFIDANKGKVWRIGLKSDGTKEFGPDQFFHLPSGLSIVQGHRGEIIMPQVKKKKVVVLKPDYKLPDAVQILAVTPFRGGKEGGNIVLVTGHNFGSNPIALFGKSPCTDFTEVTATSFKCTTPPGNGVVNVSVSVNGSTAMARGAFWYMDI